MRVNARFGSEKTLRLIRLFYTLGAVILALLLVGCGERSGEVLDATPAPFESVVDAVEPFTSPLSTPDTQDTPLLERKPTPKPNLATVHGTLLLNGKPATGYTLYLAPIIQTGGEDGMESAALDAVNDPRAEPDRSGYFHFIDVEPGRYALGISSPIGPVLIKRGDTEIIVEAIEGEIIDLEAVRIVPFY